MFLGTLLGLAILGCDSIPVDEQIVTTDSEVATAAPPPEENPDGPVFSIQLGCGYLDIMSKSDVPDSNLLRFEVNVYYGESDSR